jgi:pimeloyl-ACP methyl ester carboxylesterase
VSVEPFRLDVDPALVADLQARLRRTRFADEPPDAGWDYGTNAAYLRELVAYWGDGFDWFEQQRRLNELPHFRAAIDDLTIHFAHRRSDEPDALPIVLIHGWPTGFPEMTKLLALLPDFHVVVPALPGFDFSPPPPRRGVGYHAVAGALHQLMTELGYERYGVHGTGLGAYLNGWLAYGHPSSIVGVHTHDPGLAPLVSFEPPAPPPSEDELAYRERSRRWAAAEGAYAEVQRTKPQSLGHALTDSPAGMAGWLLDKHRTWSDCHGDIERRYTKDELLTGFSMYWLTGTISSSMRAYYERVHCDPPMEPNRRFDGVPTGVAMPRDEPGFPPRRAPREMIERVHDVRHWVDLPSGGHFASWEEPEAVAASIRTFFATVRGS